MKDQHTLIDDYVKDLLNEKEKAAFELELAKDETLQQEVEFRKTIVNHFKFEQVKQTIEQARKENEIEAKAKLNTVHTTIEQAKTENIKSKHRRIRLYKSIAIAAVFFVIVTGGLFSNIFREETILTDIILTETHLQNVAAFNIAQIKSLVDKANKAIDKADFKSVLSITKQLRQEEGFETDEILQNECYIYFKEQNYKKAERQVDGIKNTELQNKVRWKLSNQYLKVGEKALAKRQLLKIQEGSYKKKAARKLKKLNR